MRSNTLLLHPGPRWLLGDIAAQRDENAAVLQFLVRTSTTAEEHVWLSLRHAHRERRRTQHCGIWYMRTRRPSVRQYLHSGNFLSCSWPVIQSSNRRKCQASCVFRKRDLETKANIMRNTQSGTRQALMRNRQKSCNRPIPFYMICVCNSGLHYFHSYDLFT